MSTHTPGPWEAFEAKDEHGDATIGIRGDGEFIATMDLVSINGGPYCLPVRGNANARLIAAAPELLEALRKVIEWLDFVQSKLGNAEELDRNIRKYGARKWVNQFGTGAGYRADEARAAIAKATGEA